MPLKLISQVSSSCSTYELGLNILIIEISQIKKKNLGLTFIQLSSIIQYLEFSLNKVSNIMFFFLYAFQAILLIRTHCYKTHIYGSNASLFCAIQKMRKQNYKTRIYDSYVSLSYDLKENFKRKKLSYRNQIYGSYVFLLCALKDYLGMSNQSYKHHIYKSYVSLWGL